MPGIWGVVTGERLDVDIDLSDAFHKEKYINYLVDINNLQKGVFGRVSIDKFHNDKIFEVRDNNLICVEGVILNLRGLLKQHNLNDLGVFISNSCKNDACFIKNLRGNFAGFVYFIEDNELILFTDHLANKTVFYFFDETTRTLIFSSELKVVAKAMRQLNFKPKLDIRGAYCLLTFGYMLGDLTLVEQIRKLPPGCILRYSDGKILIEQYYKLSSKPYIEGDEEMIIEELDRRFKEAVIFEYEKDLEYGYSHIATLSGGLDSRMNVAYAKLLGFDKLICFTFSQNDYLDEKIAKNICSNNHIEFIFYSLNNGEFLVRHIEDIVSSNDGLILYSGSSHLYNFLRNVSFRDGGLIHTGQFGDGSMGAALQGKEHKELRKGMHPNVPYSNKLMGKLKSYYDLNKLNFENDEIFTFYTRFINGSFNGNRMIEQFTEFSSPFCNVDYIDYAIRIHPKYRYKEAVYLRWLTKCVSEFSKYKWEKVGLPPSFPLPFLEMYGTIRGYLRFFIHGTNDEKISMNPSKYWWNSNPVLREKIHSVFQTNIKNIEAYPSLMDDCYNLFNEGSLSEKMQVITLLVAAKLLNL